MQHLILRMVSTASLLTFISMARAQAPIAYHLEYNAPGDDGVHIDLAASQPLKGPLVLVFARTYPGGYSQIPYDSFVREVHAFSPDGKPLPVEVEAAGPRWKIGQSGGQVAKIEYQIDVKRMEDQLRGSVETSKVRSQYAGLLGYSIFGYVEGLEEQAVTLRIDGPSGWPVLSTLAPQLPAPASAITVSAPNYYALADSQVLMGPALQLRESPGKIPLVMAVYAEGNEDSALEVELARKALTGVEDYFGDTPIKHYTVQLELLSPRPGHDYNFSQEHLDSGTFSLATTRALTERSPLQERQLNLFNYVHHMAHCWIPKRAYGVGYLPFNWEMAPVMDTIWLNEGFIHYVAVDVVAKTMSADQGAAYRDTYLNGLRELVRNAAPFIRRMSLVDLSREASFLYMDDPRTGRNVYARGALMAAEMDERMLARTAGRKGLREAIRALLVWSETNRRPYEISELPGIFSQATGVDVHDIMKHWLDPITP